MVFNLDPTKQAQEEIFAKKSHSPKHSNLYFYSPVAEKAKYQKYLGLKIDERPNFRKHLKDKCAIVNKGTEMLKKLSSTSLLSNSL